MIFDGDEKERPPALKSNLKKSIQSFKEVLTPQSVMPAARPKTPIKEKFYGIKFCTMKIRCNEPIEEAGEYDFSKHQIANLIMNPTKQIAVKALEATTPIGTKKKLSNKDYTSHTYSSVAHELNRNKGHNSENPLIELLAKKQTKIGYQTNIDMHLKNNLS